MKHIEDLNKTQLLELAQELEIENNNELLFEFQIQDLRKLISDKLIENAINEFLNRKK